LHQLANASQAFHESDLASRPTGLIAASFIAFKPPMS